MAEEKRSTENVGNQQIDNYLEGGSPQAPEENSGQAEEGTEQPTKEESKNTDENQTSDDQTSEKTSDKNETEITEKQYKELEKKLGSQGEELGKYRKLVEDVKPLLDRLDNDPELAKAIMENKIDSSLIQDVVEGKTDQKDAEAVSQANKKVKEEVGEKKYQEMSQKEMEEMMDKKLEEHKQEISKNLEQRDSMEEYEKSISDFIQNTPDFAEYAGEVEKILDETGITDIKVAYDAVKGKHLQKEQQDSDDDKSKEVAKEVASNASGGSSQATGEMKKNDEIDEYLGKVKNPNRL